MLRLINQFVYRPEATAADAELTPADLGLTYEAVTLTTADKFIYEAELRTGAGSHFRYAKHLHDALVLWFERFPETRPLVLEGTAEPE